MHVYSIWLRLLYIIGIGIELFFCADQRLRLKTYEKEVDMDSERYTKGRPMHGAHGIMWRRV